MAEKLDREKVKQLLIDADRKWFSNHSSDFRYQVHLDFMVDYLVRHYNGKGKK